MIYYVIEFQSGAAGAALCTPYTDRAAAEAAYHTVLAAAARSGVPKHGAVIITEDLFVVKKELYPHIAETESETQPEVEE